MRDQIGHAQRWMPAGDETIAVLPTLENRIAAIEVIATPVGMIDVNKYFRNAVAVQIVQFKAYVAPIVGPLFAGAAGRAQVIYYQSNDLLR